ncbi:MAG: hypothetical protein LQ349_001377 [Xanthoria aureola]|nr:MAG: hypothetical protein LQ349_001377 [Xanthoria aureola]
MTTTQYPDTVPHIQGLSHGSYTAHRLQHATPEHIHLTTRRCFIGPIPEGWLKSHRKSWYRDYINLSNYSSKAADFSASPGVSQHKRVTGLDGPSSTTNISQSFPQPDDVQEETEDDGDEETSSNHHGREDGALVERTLTEGEVRTSDRGSDTGIAQSVSPKPKNKWLQKSHNDSGDRLKKQSPKDTGAASFVTAPSEPSTSPRSVRRKRNPSFVTALEPPQPQPSFTDSDHRNKTTGSSAQGNVRQDSVDGDSPVTGDGADSRTSLLPRPYINEASDQANDKNRTLNMNGDAAVDAPMAKIPPNHVSSGMVRFNVPSEVGQGGGSNINPTLSQVSRRRSWKQFRQGQAHPGEIVKTEKMLVRIDTASQQLPEGYDENDSVKTESRTLEKWREYVVVCRESRQKDQSDFLIQLYKSRVIPTKEGPGASKRCTHEIPLLKKTTNVNLYSTLDKTLVIWLPWKGGTKIFILRPRSSSSSVEWYTFIRNTLGWKRSSDLQVNVPDLSVILQITNPFSHVEAAAKAAASESSNRDMAILKTVEAENAVANVVIQRCMSILRQSSEWSDVLENWLKHERMGLAWKRYDRLEWVHGANEQRMYGTLAMQRSHELELRPKKHYPTSTVPSGRPIFKEPAPLEGFLIRLTSQRGRVQRFGKMFFKRLYFFTHNQFLCYCRPAKALPPPPPKASLGKASKIPTPTEITNQTPLIYAVNPFPVRNGEIEWLRKGAAAAIARADEEAFVEAERRANTLLNAEGYINICRVVEVRKVHRGSTPADANVDQGPNVDFHEPVDDTRRDDGKTEEFDDERTFELVMNDGLVIRLQAFNMESKNEWMDRMRKLVEYWKLRTADDMNLLKSVRHANLEKLDIDEEMESQLGQFAEKWEVSRATASPLLFNMCGISCCRAITMSGTLYRKPRKHTTFLQCGVILCHGQLLIFHGKLRERTGKEIPHIQHERQTAIDLQNCYIYSGLVTEGDLLYQNRTFDSNRPGHHALPRVYLEDGWTSTDEDTMTCFVIWQATRKSFFKSNEGTAGAGARQRLRYVSRLGVPGRSMVFKARSRAERDHWVMSVGMEIERLQQGEEVRLVDA